MLQRATSTALTTGHSGTRPTLELVPGPALAMFRGRDAILAMQPRLAALAATTGQTGETDSLGYFLSTPDALKKTAHLLLIGDAVLGTAQPSAAVLLFEYRASVGGTRVFATSDSTGRRDVIAPPGMRARTAAFAARTLVQDGAHIVHLAFCEDHLSCDRLRNPLTGAVATHAASGLAEQTIAAELKARTSRKIGAEWALREHDIPAYLPLFATFDETLARIRPKTRSNLRYFRRRAVQELGATFVADAKPAAAELLAFNAECSYAVAPDVIAFRHETISTRPNHHVHGIRDANGRWLSIIATRRHNGFVEVDWQMNRADLPAYSLATVLRSFLIDHEISLGSTRLYMEGGTPQSIARSFLRHRVGELTVIRNSRYVHLLQRFGSLVFPPKNYVGQTLQNPDLLWKRW